MQRLLLLVDAVAALSTSSRVPELTPLLWLVRSGLAAAALGGLCSTAVFHAPIAACLGIVVGGMLPLPLLRPGSIRRLLRVEESPAHGYACVGSPPPGSKRASSAR